MTALNGENMTMTQVINALNAGHAVLLLDDPAGPMVAAAEGARLPDISAALPGEWALTMENFDRGTAILFGKMAYPLVRRGR